MCKNKMQQQNPNSTEIQSLQKAPRGWVCSSLNTEVINYSSCPCVGDTDLEQQIHTAAQDGWDRAPADHPACLVCVSECERERKVSCAGQLWVSRTDYGVFSGLNQSSYSPGEKRFLSVEVQWREGPLLWSRNKTTMTVIWVHFGGKAAWIPSWPFSFSFMSHHCTSWTTYGSESDLRVIGFSCPQSPGGENQSRSHYLREYGNVSAWFLMAFVIIRFLSVRTSTTTGDLIISTRQQYLQNTGPPDNGIFIYIRYI